MIQTPEETARRTALHADPDYNRAAMIFGDLYDLGNPKASKVPAAARPHLITLLEGAEANEARQPRRPVVAERMDALLVALKAMK
jgi:hypothetical protein